MHHFGTASSHSIRLLFSILFLLYPFGVTSLCPTHNPISQYQPGLCHEDTAEHLLLLSDLRALSTHNNHRGQGGGCVTHLSSPFPLPWGSLSLPQSLYMSIVSLMKCDCGAVVNFKLNEGRDEFENNCGTISAMGAWVWDTRGTHTQS